MTVKECYEMLGGNYEEAKSRLMSDKLITKFIIKFLADPTMEQLRDAVKNNDHESSFRAAHTMKGVAANMAFSELQKNASELTEQLRGNEEPADPSLVENVEHSYEKVVNTIKKFQEESA